MTNRTLYIDLPCERCGSKKFISRVWKEKIPTYSGGLTEVEYSQIDCTNTACQQAFLQQQAEEAKRKEAIRVKKIETDALRKANSVMQAKKTRSNKSRI